MATVVYRKHWLMLPTGEVEAEWCEIESREDD